MPEYYELTDLTVVGYDDRLTEEMTPMVVSPIFRNAEGRYLFAPYTIQNGVVYGGQLVDRARYQQLCESESLTKLNADLPARPDFDLWVDSGMTANYEPMGEVSEKLKAIAATFTDQAKAALKSGDYDKADQFCRRAFCANERLVDALVIRALVADLNGKGANYRPILEALIEDLVSPALFQAMVEDLRKQCVSEPSPPRARSCSAMSNMALIKPLESQAA